MAKRTSLIGKQGKPLKGKSPNSTPPFLGMKDLARIKAGIKKGNLSDMNLLGEYLRAAPKGDSDLPPIMPKTKSEVNLARAKFLRGFSKNKWISQAEVRVLVSVKVLPFEAIHRIAMKIPLKTRLAWVKKYYQSLKSFANFENFAQSTSTIYQAGIASPKLEPKWLKKK